jgi:activating signal cointegrator complex subunit 3
VGKLTSGGDKGNTQGLMPTSIALDLEKARISLDQIFSGQDDDLIEYSVGPSYANMISRFVQHIPQLQIKIETKTLTRSILEIHLTLYPKFSWNKKWNGRSEPFWILISNGDEIFTSQLIDIASTTKFYDGSRGMTTTFFVPYEIDDDEEKARVSTYYEIDVLSDRWVGVDFYHPIYLEDIEVPEKDYPHTKLLPLKPLPLSALKNPLYEKLYSPKFDYFNPVQTQVFFSLYHTDNNILIGAPTSSGKTIMSELGILRVFNERPGDKIIYIAPMKALAKERIIDWKRRFQEGDLDKTVVELTGDFTPDLEVLKKADLIITTPEKWDGISRNWQHREYVRQVALVIIDEIHLLGQERGPVIEVIVSRFRYITAQTKHKVRFIGLSTALANAKDVADWLGVNRFGLYNFKPSVRPVPIEVYIDGFPEKHYCPRMATMNKPTYKAIMTHARDHPTLVFVSSRRQTRLTALDLISLISGSQLSGDSSYIGCNLNNEELEAVQYEIDDENLKSTIQFGIGMHHAGLTESDRKLVENLFVNK